MKNKTWDDFRGTGLLFLVNTILHAFGWAIVMSIDDATGRVVDAFPARVDFRGFDEKSQGEEYKKIGEYLSLNSESLKVVD